MVVIMVKIRYKYDEQDRGADWTLTPS